MFNFWLNIAVFAFYHSGFR